MILILVFSESMCYRGEVYQYLSMKSLLLHTEHNAVKRVLSLMLILSFEFSAFAHAGILAIMPVEKQWFASSQNPSILGPFLYNRSPISILPVFTPVPQIIYRTPQITNKSAVLSTAVVAANNNINDGWLDMSTIRYRLNPLKRTINYPIFPQTTWGSGSNILIQNTNGSIASIPLASFFGIAVNPFSRSITDTLSHNIISTWGTSPYPTTPLTNSMLYLGSLGAGAQS